MSLVGNAIKYAVYTYALDLPKTTIENAAVYGFASRWIKETIGDGVINTPLRVMGGIWLTNVLDPAHPMTLRNVVHIKCAEAVGCLVMSFAWLSLQAIGEIMHYAVERSKEQNLMSVKVKLLPQLG